MSLQLISSNPLKSKFTRCFKSVIFCDGTFKGNVSVDVIGNVAMGIAMPYITGIYAGYAKAVRGNDAFESTATDLCVVTRVDDVCTVVTMDQLLKSKYEVALVCIVNGESEEADLRLAESIIGCPLGEVTQVILTPGPSGSLSDDYIESDPEGAYFMQRYGDTIKTMRTFIIERPGFELTGKLAFTIGGGVGISELFEAAT